MASILTALVAAAFAGRLGPPEAEVAAVDPLYVPDSACDEGWPFDLVQLPPSELYAQFRDDRNWGSPTMVAVIQDAAERVALQYPDSKPLLVGDISQRNGGDLPPHITHDDGRSADIGLFGWTGTVESLNGGFPKLSPKQLDPERTWAVIEALLATGRVEHILLDQRHIDRLEAWLLETGRKTPEETAALFPPLTTPRLWARTGYVRHAANHAEHLHVRVTCAAPGPYSRT